MRGASAPGVERAAFRKGGRLRTIVGAAPAAAREEGSMPVQIDESLTLNEVVRRVPSAVAVFKRLGIDACCGGEHTLAQMGSQRGFDVFALLAEIRQEAEEAERVSREIERHY